MSTRKKEQAPFKFDVPDVRENIQQAINKLKEGQELTSEEDALLLTPSETAQALSILKGSEVTPRYLSEMIRLGKLEPAMHGPGRSYLYRMSIVRQVKFNPPGRPITKDKTA